MFGSQIAQYDLHGLQQEWNGAELLVQSTLISEKIVTISFPWPLKAKFDQNYVKE